MRGGASGELSLPPLSRPPVNQIEAPKKKNREALEKEIQDLKKQVAVNRESMANEIIKNYFTTGAGRMAARERADLVEEVDLLKKKLRFCEEEKKKLRSKWKTLRDPPPELQAKRPEQAEGKPSVMLNPVPPTPSTQPSPMTAWQPAPPPASSQSRKISPRRNPSFGVVLPKFESSLG